MFKPWRERTDYEKTLIILFPSVFVIFGIGLMTVSSSGKAIYVTLLLFGGLIGILPLLLFLQLTVVAVHELGHYFAGRIVGFKFRSMKIGPFYWWRKDNRLAFEWDRKILVLTGYAGMAWTDTRNLVRRHVLFALGGPVASALFFGGLLWLLLWQRSIADRHTHDISFQIGIILLWATLLTAGGTVLSCSIPRCHQGIPNDAMDIWMALTQKDDAEYQALAARFKNQLLLGDRCRDWNIPDLEELYTVTQPPIQKAYYELSLGHAMIYQDRVEDGLAHLEGAYQATKEATGIHDHFEKQVALDVAFALAYFKTDLVGAEEALARAERSSLKAPYSINRAKAAIALLKGDGEEAIRLARAALEELRATVGIFKPVHEACVEEMADLEAKAQSDPTTLV